MNWIRKKLGLEALRTSIIDIEETILDLYEDDLEAVELRHKETTDLLKELIELQKKANDINHC